MNDSDESRSVLVVHDSHEQREAVARALTRHGFRVADGAIGGDVLDRLRGFSPDVVVIGFPLVSVDAMDICSAAIGLSRPAVIIALVDHAEVTRVAGLLGAGVCDFVLNQHRDDELVARIRVHLRARGRLPRTFPQAAAKWRRPLPEPPTPGEGIRLRHPRAGRAGAVRARVLVLETHPDLGYALRAVLQMRGFSVTLRRQSDALLADVLTRNRDAVVLDLAHVEAEFVALCQGVRKAGFLGPIIATAATVSEPARNRAIDAGATDVVTLPELLPYLEGRYPSADKTGASEQRDSVDLRAVEAALTNTEFKVFEMLFAAPSDKVDRKCLKASLSLSDGALEQHVRRMTPKLRIFGIAIETIRGFGYRLVRTPMRRAHT